jgi:hypothetical protein
MVVVMSVLTGLMLLLGCSAVLLLGLLSVLRDVLRLNVQDEPTFHHTATAYENSMVHGLAAKPRSQFAWQSRSHFRAPD